MQRKSPWISSLGQAVISSARRYTAVVELWVLDGGMGRLVLRPTALEQLMSFRGLTLPKRHCARALIRSHMLNCGEAENLYV